MQLKLICAVLVLSVVAFGQTVSLRGHVTDETGAVVPGAEVELKGPSGFCHT